MLILFLAHYVADFVCQNRMMGENKSKEFQWLLKHVVVYALVVGLLTFPIFQNWESFFYWIIINFCIHLATDAVTSRLSGYYYRKSNMWGFWNVIGIDQMSHYATLYYTFIWLN